MKLSENIRETYLSLIMKRINLLKEKGVEITQTTLDTIVHTELVMNGDEHDQEDYDFFIKEIEYYAQIKHTPGSVIYDS